MDSTALQSSEPEITFPTRKDVDTMITERLILFRKRLEADGVIPPITKGLGGVVVD